MVLRTITVRRVSVDAENTPPALLKPRSSRLRTSYDPNRRRTRTISSSTAPRTPRYLAEQAKRRDAMKHKAGGSTPKPNPIRDNFVQASSSDDIEMKDAPTFVPSVVPVPFPRRLGRPPFQEVSLEAIVAADPTLVGVPAQYIRDQLHGQASRMLSSISAVRANAHPTDLPGKMKIEMKDPNAICPTHMLAAYAATPQPGTPRKVTLYPIHSMVLAAHCSKLPHFRPSEAAGSSTASPLMIPIVPLSLPSPDNFEHLLFYLYHKTTTPFLNCLLPMQAPQIFEDDPSGQTPAFATRIGRTFTTDALIEKILQVRKMWLNVIALGIFDEGLWQTIDLAWDVLLTALAVSCGTPRLMIPY